MCAGVSPGWDEPIPAVTPPAPLSHGYDDKLPDSEIGLEQVHSAAAYRGGTCAAATLAPGDLLTPLDWACAFDHQSQATPYLVLRAGHWCPECLAPPWRDRQIADANPFFAQIIST